MNREPVSPPAAGGGEASSRGRRAKYEVFIIDSAAPRDADDRIEREILQGCARLQLLRLHQEEEFVPYASRADAVIVWHDLRFTSAILGKLPKARLIVRNGVGYDSVDIAAAAAAGIRVANVPDYGSEEVADHALTLTLALVRQLKPLMANVSDGKWQWRAGLNCRRIRGRTVGVVGCGRIGTALALRAKALGFSVSFYDPYLAPGYEKAIGVQRSSSLEELLAAADVVSVHVPLNEETRHLFGRREFSRMKKSAYLVNTARGAVVSSEALRAALSQGEIAGAALDVLEREPSGAAALQALPNCIVTPHCAFYSQESLTELRTKSALMVRDALLYGRYANVVNQEGLAPRGEAAHFRHQRQRADSAGPR